MTLWEINPFVRFARDWERGFSEEPWCAADHRIFYCISGEAKILLEQEDWEEELEIKPGDVVFWRGGISYQVFLSDKTRIAGFNFDFTDENVKLSTPVLPQSIDEGAVSVLEKIKIEDGAIFQRFFHLHQAFSLRDAFLRVVEEFEKKQIYYTEQCSAILKEILITCVRLSKTDHDRKSAQLAREVLDYIKENYHTKLTNEGVAKHFTYHPNYLGSLVLQHTGKSMHRYINELRINEAIYLLQFTKLSVGEIALRVGVSDLKHFSKLFKTITGQPPTAFRPR